MFKKVNGVDVELTAEEVAELSARDEAHAKRISEEAKTEYKELRKREYPEESSQLDAILEQLNYMKTQGQTTLVPELETVVSDWLSVKAKYPKPE